MEAREKRELIVIGVSTGGLAALKLLLAGLPANLQATVLIVMHVGSQESILPQLLGAHSALPVRHARDYEPMEPGVVLIAPPDYHLLVTVTHLRLSRGPKENFSRPAIDPLFRSAALNYRQKVIGVILSGNLDDGTVGLQVIKAYGGIAVVQDPADAEAPDMPRSALENVDIDYCLPLEKIAELLAGLVDAPPEKAPGDSAARNIVPVESRFASMKAAGMEDLEKIGTLSSFTCPECHGSLWEIANARPQRYRCHTGHAFTARTLAFSQNQLAEEAIWGAVRALHEKEALLRRFAQTAVEEKRLEAAAEHAASANQVSRQAQVLLKMIREA
jgi:two-component system chemotaxis response regulator CheB